MLQYLAVLAVLSVAWYTVNVARVAWRDGNKGGAVLVGLLAVVGLAAPLLKLLVFA